METWDTGGKEVADRCTGQALSVMPIEICSTGVGSPNLPCQVVFRPGRLPSSRWQPMQLQNDHL